MGPIVSIYLQIYTHGRNYKNKPQQTAYICIYTDVGQKRDALESMSRQQLCLPFYNVGTSQLFTTTVWLGDQKRDGQRVGPFLDPLPTIFVSPPSPPLDHAAAWYETCYAHQWPCFSLQHNSVHFVKFHRDAFESMSRQQLCFPFYNVGTSQLFTTPTSL